MSRPPSSDDPPRFDGLIVHAVEPTGRGGWTRRRRRGKITDEDTWLLLPDGSTTMAEELVGSVTHYFAKPGVGVVAITDGDVEVGDTIHVVGAHSDFTMKVASLEIDHAAVESAGVGASVGIKMPERAREHDRVFVVT